MARVTDRERGTSVADPEAIRVFLADYGIWYRRIDVEPLPADATDAQILAAYAEPIDELKAAGGYVTADVIDVHPETPGLEQMLAKFASEHAHSEDEVRLVVGGRGLFHVHPARGPVFSIEVEAGDAINVPAGTLHWFNLCEDRSIRAIRLFQDAAGWVPEYTGSGVDREYRPHCFGQPTAG